MIIIDKQKVILTNYNYLLPINTTALTSNYYGFCIIKFIFLNQKLKRELGKVLQAFGGF